MTSPDRGVWVTCQACDAGKIPSTTSNCRACHGRNRLPINVATESGRGRYKIAVLDQIRHKLIVELHDTEYDGMTIDGMTASDALEPIEDEWNALYLLECETDCRKRWDLTTIEGLDHDRLT